MRSTGEVMGIGVDFGAAFHKRHARRGHAGCRFGHGVFISVRDATSTQALPVVRHLMRPGIRLVATGAPRPFIRAAGLPCEVINKVKPRAGRTSSTRCSTETSPGDQHDRRGAGHPPTASACAEPP
jgi:hypothetical protein